MKGDNENFFNANVTQNTCELGFKVWSNMLCCLYLTLMVWVWQGLFKKCSPEPASCMHGIAQEQSNELKMAQFPLLNISYFFRGLFCNFNIINLHNLLLFIQNLYQNQANKLKMS